jgi:tetratricopeptide (TPR) repeat protein
MENLINEAINNHQIGKLDRAIKLYSKILISDSKNLDVLFLIATAMIQNNDNHGAIKKLKEYINININNFHVYSNLGIAYSNINRNNEAIASFKKSISLNPKFHHNYNNLGNIYLKTNQLDEALVYFNKALNIQFDEDIMFNRALTYFKIENNIEALSDLDLILKNNYLHIKSINLRVDILNNIDKQSSALSFLKQYDLSFFRNNQQLLKKYIDIKINLYQFSDINQFISILKTKDDKNFLTGNIHFKKGDFFKAEEYYLQCKNYLNNSNILNNLGLLYSYYGDYDKSFVYFNKALSIDPDNKNVKLNLGLNYLKLGNYTDGFDNYYYRRKFKPIELPENIPELRSFENISDKKILVLNEQGIGDQILFMNILNNFTYSNFNFLIDRRIISFYQYNYPQITFITNEKINFKPYTDYIFLGDLLKYFIKSTNDIKFCSKFLSLPENPNNQNTVRKTLLNCGLSWKSPKSNLEIRDHKSLELLDIFTTLSNFNFEFYNIQYGDIERDIQNIKEHYKISINIPPFDLFNDILNLLYFIDSLDLVITTSNVTAHLAGILGKKTFLLIPKTNFNLWYWPSDGQSQWYENTNIIFYEKNNMSEFNLKFIDALTCYAKSIN